MGRAPQHARRPPASALDAPLPGVPYCPRTRDPHEWGEADRTTSPSSRIAAPVPAQFYRVFDGRELRVVGRLRQRIPANWKLMVENIKDPYHASLLHVFLVSFGLFSRAVQKILGAQLLTDLSGFVAALDSMFGGFRQRADETYRILQDPQTAFLIVAVPERDAVREAAYFAERLVTDRMPLAGLVLNRTHRTELAGIGAETAENAATALDRAGDQQVTADALRVHAGLVRQIEREVRVAATFSAHLAMYCIRKFNLPRRHGSTENRG